MVEISGFSFALIAIGYTAFLAICLSCLAFRGRFFEKKKSSSGSNSCQDALGEDASSTTNAANHSSNKKAKISRSSIASSSATSVSKTEKKPKKLKSIAVDKTSMKSKEEIFDFSIPSSPEAEQETSSANGGDSSLNESEDIYTLASLRSGGGTSSAFRLSSSASSQINESSPKEENDVVVSVVAGGCGDDEENWSIATKKAEAKSESSLKAKITRLEEECLHFKDSYSALNKLYDEAKAKNDLYEREKRQLNMGNTQKIAALEGEIAAVKASNATLTSELSKAKSLIASFDSNSSLQAKEIESQKAAEIALLRDEIGKMQQNHENENAILLEQLSKAQSQLEKQQQVINVQLEKEKSESFQMYSLKTQLDENKAQLSALQSEMSGEKQKADLEIAQKNAQLTAFQAEIQQLQQELLEKKLLLEENAQKFKTFEIIVAEFESSKALLLASQASLESEKMMRIQAEGEIAQLKQEIGELKIGMESSSSSSAEQEKESQVISTLRKELELVTEAKEQSRQNALHLEEQISSLKTSLEDSMMKVANGALALEEAKAEIAEISACNEKNLALQKKREIECEELRQELELCNRALNAFKNRIRENETQLKALKQELTANSSTSSLSNA